MRKRRRAIRRQAIEYAQLEPRIVLDAAALMADRTFDLPADVSLKLGEALGEYDRAVQGNVIPGSTQLVLLGTPMDAPLQDYWGSFDILGSGAEGTTTDSSISTLASDGGGHLVFQDLTTLERTFVGTTTTANSQGFYPGLSVTTTETKTYRTVHFATQGEADAAVAAGEVDPEGMPSALDFTVTRTFTFIENAPEAGEFRNFTVETDYSISIALVWGGTGSFTVGDTSQTVSYDLSLLLTASGDLRYDGIVTQDGSGGDEESYQLFASGIFSTVITSGNSVVTTTVIDTETTDSTEVSGRIDAFSYLNAGDYSIDASGGITYATGAEAVDLTRIDTDTFTLTADSDTWSTYDEVTNLSSHLTDDPEDTTEGVIFKPSGNGSSVSSLIEIISSSASAQNRYHAYGNSSYLYAGAVYPAGNQVESLGGVEYTYVDTTGNTGEFSTTYESVASNDTGRSISRFGLGGSVEADEISIINTTTSITADKTTPESEAAINGVVIAMGSSPLLTSVTETEYFYDFRDGWASSTEADENGNHAAVAANAAALSHLESYGPGGLGSTAVQAAVTGNAPGAEAGKAMNFSWIAGKSTSLFSDQNDGDVTYNTYLTLNSMVGDSLRLEGSSDMLFTASDTYADSADFLRSFGDYDGQDGAITLSQTDYRGYSNTHGMYGDDYDYTITEMDPESTLDPEAASGYWFDKYNILGNSSSYYNDTVDSGNDVSKTNDNIKADFTTDPENYFRFESHSNFDETETVDSGSSSVTDDTDYKGIGQGVTTSSSGDLATTILGSGDSGYTLASSFSGLLDPNDSEGGSGHAIFYRTDANDLTSTGSRTSNWDGTQLSGVKRLNTEDPENDPPMIEPEEGTPIYEFSDDRTTYSRAGNTTSNGGLQYRFNSQLSTFVDDVDISFATTELSHELRSRLENVTNPVSYVMVTDNTTASTDVQADGVALTTSGLRTTTIVDKSRLTNPEEIVTGYSISLPDTSTHSVFTTHLPDTIVLDTDTTITLTEDYDDWGIKLSFENEDLGEGIWDYLIPKISNTGKLTAQQKINGTEFVEMHPTTVDSLVFTSNATSFNHTHHEDSATTTTYNDLANQQEVEFLSGGGWRETYSRSGNMTVHNTRNTNGSYTWNDLSQKLGFDNPNKHDEGEATYNSQNGYVDYSVTPSGSITLHYDADGELSSFSGAFVNVRHAAGSVDTELNGRGMAFYQYGSSVYVATRAADIQRNASFTFDETETIIPELNSEGDLVYNGSKSATSNQSHSLSGTDIRSVYMAMSSTIAVERAHIESVGFSDPGTSTTTTSSSSTTTTSTGTGGGPGSPPPPDGGGEGGSTTPSTSVIRNYLLEPTDFAIDYGPEGGSISSLDDLTVFKELYGYRGTAVTASFSTELPDGSQDDFADGDTLLADHLESATEFVGITSGGTQGGSGTASSGTHDSDLDLSEQALLGLLGFIYEQPEIFEAYAERYGAVGVERLAKALEWGYSFNFDADYGYDLWGLNSINGEIGIDSWGESPAADAAVLNTALVNGMKPGPGNFFFTESLPLIRGFDSFTNSDELYVRQVRLRDLWVNWQGKSFNEAARNLDLAVEMFWYNVGTSVGTEAASELAGHGLGAAALKLASVGTLVGMARSVRATRGAPRGILNGLESFKFNGAVRIDSLRNATHADIVKAFKGTQFTPSGHFIKRLKDVRTDALGIKSFKDLETIFRKGSILDADDDLLAIVHDGMAIIVNPQTGRLVTFRPWK